MMKKIRSFLGFPLRHLIVILDELDGKMGKWWIKYWFRIPDKLNTIYYLLKKTFLHRVSASSAIIIRSSSWTKVRLMTKDWREQLARVQRMNFQFPVPPSSWLLLAFYLLLLPVNMLIFQHPKLKRLVSIHFTGGARRPRLNAAFTVAIKRSASFVALLSFYPEIEKKL